ncbi:MAG: hypothetical protein QXP39_00520 [Candidatus Aenigmatarchaeota archaeon]
MAGPEKVPPKKLTVRDILNELIERTNTDTRRLRVLEEKADTFATRADNMEASLFEQKKSMTNMARELNDRISQIEDRIAKIETTVKEIVEQLKRVATTSKIRELEELIEIYNPLKSQFITKQEVERMIEERMK